MMDSATEARLRFLTQAADRNRRLASQEIDPGRLLEIAALYDRLADLIREDLVKLEDTVSSTRL